MPLVPLFVTDTLTHTHSRLHPFALCFSSSRYPANISLWSRRPAQHPRYRLIRPQFGRPVRHVWTEVLSQDCLHDSEADGTSPHFKSLSFIVTPIPYTNNYSLHSDLTRTNHSREKPDLSRHQARQLPHRTPGIQNCQPGSRRRLRHGETVSRPEDKATYSISRTKEFKWDGEIYEYQYAFGEG